jgi:hypothetical protein
MQVSLYSYPSNSFLLNIIMYLSLIPKITYMVEDKRELRVEILVDPQVECGFSCKGSYNTHSFLTAKGTDLQY